MANVSRKNRAGVVKAFHAQVENTKQDIETKDINQQLSILLATFNDQHTVLERNKVVSNKTKYNRKQDITLFMKLIDDIFKLKNIYNLQERHYSSVVDAYLKMEPKYAPGTVSNFLTNTRILYRWIGKANLLKSKKAGYVEDKERLKVSEVGLTDKSWSARYVDSDAVISLIESEHPAEGITLRLMAAFGMRFKEAICFKPHINVYVDGTHITLVDGTKGARSRVMKIETSEQREALAKAQAFVKKKTGFMMERYSSNLSQNIQRLYYICRKYGVSKKGYGITCHGLRHEFVNDHMEKNGVVSPVRGGSPEAFFSKENRQLRYEVAQMTGHNRPKVTGRYCGGKVGRIRKKALKPGVGINSSDSRKSGKQRRHRGLRKAIKVMANAKRVKELHQAILDRIKEPA